MLIRAFDDKDSERLIPVLLDILNHKNSKPSVTNNNTNEKEGHHVEALKAYHDLKNAKDFSLVRLIILIFYCFNSDRTI